jgi:hypothetical protein
MCASGTTQIVCTFAVESWKKGVLCKRFSVFYLVSIRKKPFARTNPMAVTLSLVVNPSGRERRRKKRKEDKNSRSCGKVDAPG